MDRSRNDPSLKKDIEVFVRKRNKRATGSFEDYVYNGISFPEFYHEEAERYAENKTKRIHVLFIILKIVFWMLLLIMLLKTDWWMLFRWDLLLWPVFECILNIIESLLRRRAMVDYFYQAYFDRQNEVH